MQEKIITFLLFFLGVYYNLLISVTTAVSILDEVVTLTLIFLILLQVKSIKIYPALSKFTALLIFFFVLGLCGTVYYHYQKYTVAIQGGIVYFKSFIPFIYLLTVCNKKNLNMGRLNNLIYRHYKFSLIIIIVGVVYQLLFLKHSTEYLASMPKLKSFFNPYSLYGIVVSFMAAVYFYLLGVGKVSRKSAVVILLLILFSFRLKAVAVAFLLYIFLFARGAVFNRRTIAAFLVSAVIFTVVASNTEIGAFMNQKFTDTFLSTSDEYETARSMLSLKSIQVAKEHFPFGSGYGTFGTHFSGVNYSPLYDMYNLSSIWGLTREEHSFINDTQWPAILGETGFLGLVLYVWLFYMMYKMVIVNKKIYLLKNQVLFVFLVLFVNSTSTSVFFNSNSAALYFLLGIIYFARVRYAYFNKKPLPEKVPSTYKAAHSYI